jgi:hypothetical protein
MRRLSATHVPFTARRSLNGLWRYRATSAPGANEFTADGEKFPSHVVDRFAARNLAWPPPAAAARSPAPRPIPRAARMLPLLSAACLPMDAPQVPRVRAAVNDGLLPPAKPPNGRSSRTPPSPETHEPCRSSAVTRRSQRFERRVKRIPERHVPRISRQGSSHLARHIRVADAAIWVGKPE